MTPEQYDEQKKQLEEQLRKLRDYFIDSIAKFRVGEKVRVLGAYSREDVVEKRNLNCEHWSNKYYEGVPYEVVYILQGAHIWGTFERESNLEKIEPSFKINSNFRRT